MPEQPLSTGAGLQRLHLKYPTLLAMPIQSRNHSRVEIAQGLKMICN